MTSHAQAFSCLNICMCDFLPTATNVICSFLRVHYLQRRRRDIIGGVVLCDEVLDVLRNVVKRPCELELRQNGHSLCRGLCQELIFRLTDILESSGAVLRRVEGCHCVCLVLDAANTVFAWYWTRRKVYQTWSFSVDGHRFCSAVLPFCHPEDQPRSDVRASMEGGA